MASFWSEAEGFYGRSGMARYHDRFARGLNLGLQPGEWVHWTFSGGQASSFGFWTNICDKAVYTLPAKSWHYPYNPFEQAGFIDEIKSWRIFSSFFFHDESDFDKLGYTFELNSYQSKLVEDGDFLPLFMGF